VTFFYNIPCKIHPSLEDVRLTLLHTIYFVVITNVDEILRIIGNNFDPNFGS
jgi:hypothetical protein